MNRFEQKIKDTLDSLGITPGKTRILATLSGGADSVAMLAALTALGYDCVAAHCNFHLRGDESDRDQKHAETIATRLGVKIHIKDFDVAGHMAHSPGSPSMEMACRELRYRWFEELSKETEAAYIAVAHNSDDNIETVFLNMLRGCGITGLKGMRPMSNGNILRPMLHCPRKEVEAYLSYRGMDYITDSSNLKSDVKRNKLRNNVLPELYANFPDSRKTLTHTISAISGCEELYRHLVEEKLKEYGSAGESIDIAGMASHEPHAEMLLFEALKPFGFNMDTVKSIIDNATNSGKRFESPSAAYILSRGILRKVTEDSEPEFQIDKLFEITLHKRCDFNPGRNPRIAYFDSKILESPLTVRAWKPGDRLEPYGMCGSRKVSDIFTDAKIPLDMKKRIPLLFCGEKLLWVAGLRASRLYKVTSGTGQFVTIRYVDTSIF